MPETERVRAFLALPRDRMWVESAKGLVERLRHSLPDASWTRPESWHVTLKFLGRLERSKLTRFLEAVGPVAADAIPGEIGASGALVFPSRGAARVLAIGFTGGEALESLIQVAREANRLAKQVGLEPERRDFHPHVTLARLRRPWPAEAVDTFRVEASRWSFPPWQVRSCVLYESRLHPDGAVHTPVSEWSFAGGPRGVRA